MEKYNQPWSLSMLAIAKAALTPSNDFILSGMNKLNEYVPFNSAMPFNFCQVVHVPACVHACVCPCTSRLILVHTQMQSADKKKSLSWLTDTHKTSSLIFKVGMQKLGLQMPEFNEGYLTGLLQAEGSAMCLL